MEGVTPAASHSCFISRQICFLDKLAPSLAGKISPEAIFCFFAYFFSFRHSLPGSRMTRTFPCSLGSPWSRWSPSAVPDGSSPGCGRRPAAEGIPPCSGSGPDPEISGAGYAAAFTLHSFQPQNRIRLFTAHSFVFTVAGARSLASSSRQPLIRIFIIVLDGHQSKTLIILCVQRQKQAEL